MEHNLAASIEEAKNAGSTIFKNIKHRLDYFHIFEQTWRRDCRLVGTAGASMELAIQQIVLLYSNQEEILRLNLIYYLSLLCMK